MQELLRSWREGLGMVHADNSAPGQSFTYTGQQQSCRDAVAASNASQSDVNQLIWSVIELVESIYIENVNGMRQQALVHTTLVHNTWYFISGSSEKYVPTTDLVTIKVSYKLSTKTWINVQNSLLWSLHFE